MAAVSGLGTTFNLPNYTGEVITITPTETPFLSAIGGLNGGGDVVASRQFEWQTQDHGTPSQPANLEGADAPTLGERSRSTVNNVTQIFQYAFGVSYTKMAATQQLAGLAIGQMNPVADELQYQTNIQLKEAARDINYTFLRGAYALPSDNNSARKTRGLVSAISTVSRDQMAALGAPTGVASTDLFTLSTHGLKVGDIVLFTAVTGGTGISTNTAYRVKTVPSANTFTLGTIADNTTLDFSTNLTDSLMSKGALITKAEVLDTIQAVYESFGIDGAMEPTLIVSAQMKRALTKMFITDASYQEQTRNVGGVNLTSIETDFGRINVMLERATNVLPHEIIFCHLGLCMPVYLPIPGKGFLFVEPLAKTGATERYQLYGEIGLKYGYEGAHARIYNASPMVGQ